MEVAHRWNKQHRNIGPFHAKIDISYSENIKYVVMGILHENVTKKNGSPGKIIAVEDKTFGSIDYLSILKHNDGTYAAMLPIL